MNRIHQIALRGMKGRKKDSAMLTTVIVMSFLFLTVGTTLLSSLTESQSQQRMRLYGSWKLADRHQNPVVTQRLAEQPWITGSHQVDILGKDRKCGSVSVWDDDFARMGGLQLIEGRAPEAPGEIVLEKGQLSLFQEDIGVGSKIRLEFSYEGMPGQELKDPDLPQTVEIYGVTVDAQPFYDMFAQDITVEDIEEALAQYVVQFDKIRAESERLGFPLPEFPVKLPNEIDKMTRVEIGQLLDFTTAQPEFLRMMAWTPNHLISFSQTSRDYYPGGAVGEVEWKMNSTYTLRSAAPHFSREKILKFGALTGQKLTLLRECTVVGILETTADRWDVMDITVPNSYVSEPTRQELLKTVKLLAQAERPEKLSAEPEKLLAGESYTLYETAVSMADTYDMVQSLPGNLMEPRPLEDLYNVDVTLPDITPEELEQEALAALSGTSYTMDDVDKAYQNQLALYRVSFASGDQIPVNAYFLVPSLQVDMNDGSSLICQMSFGYLIYQDADRWDTRKVDVDTLQSTDFAPEGYTSLGYLRGTLEDAYAYNTQSISINRYAYPAERGLAATMGSTLVAVIVIITVCAVFQIFFTQLRRRTRKLTLLRSIGATNAQIFGILGFEGLYITLAGLVMGDSLGVLISWLIVRNLNDAVFHVDWRLFVSGQFWGVLAVAAGLLMPSIKAIHAPLVGRMDGKRRHHVKIKAMKRQTFIRICLRDLKANPGRTFGTAGLCIFLVTMELCCVFLGNAAFGTYRQTILDADKPDFTLTMNHAGTRRKVEPMIDAIGQIEGMQRWDFYRHGENLSLWYEGMQSSPVVCAVQETDSRFFAPSKSPSAARTDPALLTEFYGIESDTELFARICHGITEGSVDQTAYDEGEEVILILPMYVQKHGGQEPKGTTMAEALRTAGRMEFSLSPDAARLWDRDTSISPGSAVTLGTDVYTIMENNADYRQSLLETKVAAIVRYFPEGGIWPFAGDPQSHVVIGSAKAMAKLYAVGFTTYDTEQMKYIDARVEYFMPTEYAEAVWSLYAKDGADVETTLSPLSRFARQEHLTLHSFMDSKRTVYEKALSSGILAGAMATAATVIVWMILFNTLNAAQEQGRSRTGILQTLGITRKQFYQAQAMQALGYWAAAVVISNVLVLLLVLIFGAAQQAGQSISLAAGVQLALQKGLRGYPWGLHGILCLLQLPVLLVFSVHAAKKTMAYSPIENIRS